MFHTMNVLVTGASAGFGVAIAEQFVRAGHAVVAAARRTKRLEQLQDRVGSGRLHICTMDVSDLDSIRSGLESIPSSCRPIDVLINNAGLALGLEPSHQTSVQDWNTMINTNCLGAVALTRLLLPEMVNNKKGLIINMGSVAGIYPYPGSSVYGASKAFLHQFTNNLRADLVGTGVRATTIAPGLCSGTEFSQVRFGGDIDRARAVYEGTQALTASDIAETVYWVATRPPHININMLELMPTCQGFGPFAIHRQPSPLSVQFDCTLRSQGDSNK